jgi:release factor glutamine methyltransferase
VVDVCTGSGCIAVTIAKEGLRLGKALSVAAVDISPEALGVAKLNAERHQVSGIVECIEGDLLGPIEPSSCDFVLSNPPYVSESEFQKLEKSVRDFEPKLALVSGDSGTEIIERLIDQGWDRLKPGGWIIFEHSPMIAATCQKLLEDSGRWREIRQVKDLAGLARVLVAQKPS